MAGRPTLATESGETLLCPGMCAGFKAGVANGHHLVNRSGRIAHYLEVGSRMSEEDVVYSDIDMKAEKRGGGPVVSTRKDGTPY